MDHPGLPRNGADGDGGGFLETVTLAQVVEELAALNRDLEVPTPAAHGIDGDRWHELIPTMCEQALASGSPANNPRVPTAEEMARLYRQVWGA